MSINYKKVKVTESLDETRLNKGIDKLKATFLDLINNNPEKAVKLINDKNLQFPSLFILQPQIKETDLFTV